MIVAASAGPVKYGGRRDKRRQDGRRHSVQRRLDARMDRRETRQHKMAADACQIGGKRPREHNPCCC
jgi:hypothetical protein